MKIDLPLLTFIAALFISGCHQSSEDTIHENATLIKLGFAAPLTGPQALYGKDMQNGIELAIDEINRAHPKLQGQPIQFQLIAEDDQADPRIATQIAQRFVDAKVSGILGHFNSGTSIPASKIYYQAGIAQLAMASSALYTQQNFDTAFRMFTSDAQQGKAMGDFVVTQLKHKRIVIIDDRTSYGQGLANEFEKAAHAAGGNILLREYTSDKETDFMSLLTSLKHSKADAIFYAGTAVQSASLVKQMRRLGLKAAFFSGDMSYSDFFLKSAKQAAEGSFVSIAGVPLNKMPGHQKFTENYIKRYGAVQLYAPYAYDGAKAMMQAILKADSANPNQYLPILAQTNMPAVTVNTLQYDAQGDIKDNSITVYQVIKGKWEVYAIIKSKPSTT
jgi:branched-chain amino acid transport system substrate-binding protein